MENGFFETVESLSDIYNLKDKLVNEFELGFDIETTGLDWITDKITLIQISTREGKAYLLDVIGLKDDEVAYLLHFIKDKKLIGHNIKFDMKFIKQKYGYMFENVHDTMITEAILFAGIRKPYYTLYDLVKKYCDVSLDKDVRNEFIGNEIITYDMLVYAAEDVIYLLQVYEKQLERIKNHSLDKILDLECKLIPVVASMEMTGIRLDQDKWMKLVEKATARLITLTSDIMKIILDPIDFTQFESGKECFETYKIAYKSKRKAEREEIENTISPVEMEGLFRKYYNIGSTYQLQAWINRETSLELTSTANKIIVQIQNEHELFPFLLEWRELQKKTTTYGKDFLKHIHPVTGKIHTTFNQMGTATGRFSSNSPNLQNIPLEKDYRACFIADEGTKLLAWDYSQMELRVAGAVTKEPVIIDAFKNDLDLHSQTASMMFEVPYDEVENEQRQIAKTFNFAQQYGSTAHGISFNFNMPIEEAYELERKYKRAMPVLDVVKTALENRVLELGYSKTPLGRRRYFTKNKNFSTDPKELERHFKKIKREGFNHIIQGGSADITKLALIALYYNNPFGDAFRLVLTVHDEIEAIVDFALVGEAEKFMKETMEEVEQPFLGEIPAKAEGTSDYCWVH